MADHSPMHEHRPSKRTKREPEEEEDDEEEDDEDMEEEVMGPNGKKVKGKGGSSCHQCKSRRNFGALLYCTSNLDKKNKRCRKKFCGHCLKKFYKESSVPADKTTWRCPSCRKICCCAACRRRKTKEAEREEAASAHKAKKSGGSHKAHRDAHRYDTGQSRGAQRRDHDDGGYQEGYPSSSSQRRGDRSLLHGGAHSPRLSGHMMSDSPMRRGMHDDYDMDASREDDYSDEEQSYSDSDSERPSDSEEDDSGHVPSHGQYAHMHDEDPQASLPSSQFTSLLSAHIKTLAEEAQRAPSSPFARLYAQAQQSKVKRKIKAILLRPDIKKEKKVELIAGILSALEENGHDMPAAHDSSAMPMR